MSSVAGFGSEVTALLLFLGYAAGSSAGIEAPALLACCAVPLGLLALVTPRWLPAAQPGGADLRADSGL